MTESKLQGDIGEEVAAGYLKNKGYQIIGRNFHSLYGEIDIIALREDKLAFVEVKLRKSSVSEAFSSISASKKKKLIRTALSYLQQYPRYEKHIISFDVIAVIKSVRDEEYMVKHLRNAFLVDEVRYEL